MRDDALGQSRGCLERAEQAWINLLGSTRSNRLESAGVRGLGDSAAMLMDVPQARPVPVKAREHGLPGWM